MIVMFMEIMFTGVREYLGKNYLNLMLNVFILKYYEIRESKCRESKLIVWVWNSEKTSGVQMLI